MGDWVEDMTPKERQNWDGFVDAVRKDAVQKIAQSAFVASLVPSGDTDIKFAVELGLAILLDKPVVAIAFPGRAVPPGLRRVAHSVIELDHDMDIEAGRLEMQRKFSAVMEDLGMT
jgi:hypothetical protein